MEDGAAGGENGVVTPGFVMPIMNAAGGECINYSQLNPYKGYYYPGAGAGAVGGRSGGGEKRGGGGGGGAGKRPDPAQVKHYLKMQM